MDTNLENQISWEERGQDFRSQEKKDNSFRTRFFFKWDFVQFGANYEAGRHEGGKHKEKEKLGTI